VDAEEHQQHLHQQRQGEQHRDRKLYLLAAVGGHARLLFHGKIAQRMRIEPGALHGFYQGVQACPFGVVVDVRLLGGDVHRGYHFRQLVQNFFQARGAGCAVHAGDLQIGVG